MHTPVSESPEQVIQLYLALSRLLRCCYLSLVFVVAGAVAILHIHIIISCCDTLIHIVEHLFVVYAFLLLQFVRYSIANCKVFSFFCCCCKNHIPAMFISCRKTNEQQKKTFDKQISLHSFYPRSCPLTASYTSLIHNCCYSYSYSNSAVLHFA